MNGIFARTREAFLEMPAERALVSLAALLAGILTIPVFAFGVFEHGMRASVVLGALLMLVFALLSGYAATRLRHSTLEGGLLAVAFGLVFFSLGNVAATSVGVIALAGGLVAIARALSPRRPEPADSSPRPSSP